MFANISSWPVTCLFIFLIVSFEVWKFFCCYLMETGWVPPCQVWLGVETLIQHMHQEGMKSLLLNNETFWGEQGTYLKRPKNGLKKQGKGFVFIVVREWGWSEDSWVWELGLACFELACLNLATKVGATRIFYQLAQMWGRRGKWNCGVWKMSAVKMIHQNVRLLITV